ncbi:enoyl-CoA hydratase/isomerase family protein [Colwellia sp. MB3u-70]|uniref:3-hydroxyacyl-CoA dehydrogenase NAD-binding domain-containing protein n=1 Tax=unclassified Colwellia TaxID=196834 RepID=UPI0015F38B04|nr:MULTISPECIES: 3-hydroxyacyl-CoA dehydrogenase NAD-binding domain-containing protein [unclassified Colwellia]MBA6293644.1 enoyl-CoA hydratase/isomerase family protein [Colwellia sp. MB3u-8]MBA6308929.1 enoyl-CoA hydratase/isomerase family protein [Colwellia sp. MB3u-70]
MSVVSYQLEGDIGVISLNNPPVNALSHALRLGIQDAVVQAQNDASLALVLICQGRTFIAGADISEFGKAPMLPSLPGLLDIIEASTKPIIAAIHGTALGGGLETALACHYRCALSSAKVGLPEVKLGLLPGAGGTQRVPRLAGVKAALDLITTGTPITAANALKIGLIDKVVEGDLLSAALDFAQDVIAQGGVLKRVRDIAVDKTDASADFFAEYRGHLSKRFRQQEAPQRIVECIEAALSQPFDEGLKVERRLFVECMQSTQSAALRHLFFAERMSSKIKGLPKDTQLKDIKRVGIIGGGTMGGGIAMNFVNANIPVTLLEINQEALQRGKDIIAKNYAMTVKKGKLTTELAAERQALITGTTDYNDLADMDLVIEAVFENLAIKKQVFAKLDSVCKPGAILASNTSYQDVNLIAESTSRPQDVIGLHFFSPANVMKLLEIVRGDKTSEQVLATSMAMAKTIKKIPALSRVCYGFIGNRMLRQYAREAQLCLLEGSSPEAIDRVMQNFGMAMGPLAVGDLAGIDIGYKAREGLTDEEKGDVRSYCIADALYEMGRLGQKTGAGYYRYDAETRQRIADPIVLEVIEAQAKQRGVERKAISDETILARLTFALINEGFKILEEGIAQRPSDIDVVYAFGYGFPAFRGGPMFYAETIGLEKVYQTICQFGATYGEEFWQPAALLKQLVAEGKSLSEWSNS